MLITINYLIVTLNLITAILGSGSKTTPREIPVDVGLNATLPCPLPSRNVMWVHEGKDATLDRLHVFENGSLYLTRVDKTDSGVYTCSSDDDDSSSLSLRVRTPPPFLTFQVHPSTILALLIWSVNDTGGYPIVYFTAQFKPSGTTESDWTIISPTRISPNIRQMEVYKLEPNTTYSFRIWATNQLGAGEMAEIEERTLCNNQELELVRHFLEGADKFDTRMWLIAVGIVMGTLVLLAFGTCLLLYQECRTTGDVDDPEVMELVPNIILNPGFESRTGNVQDENTNSESTTRLDNNTVVRPRNI